MSLEITYFAEGRNRSLYGSPITSETRTASGVSQFSFPTPASAEVVRIKSLANNRFCYGANPVATATAGDSGHYIAAGDIIDMAAVPGWKIAVITAG